MNLAAIIKNDIVDNDRGFCVSLWFNGCPHRCKGCHNKDLWEATNLVDNEQVILEVYNALTDRGIQRDLSILGGEPLSEDNRQDCLQIIKTLKDKIPSLRITLWTGYIYEQIRENETIQEILQVIDRLIDGPFIMEQKKTLLLRGSENQRILCKGKDF